MRSVFFFILGLMICIDEVGAQTGAHLAGEILKKTGVVMVDGKPAEVGTFVFEGSLVKSEGGTATIVLFNDEGVLHVGENTEIKVEKYRPQASAETSAEVRLQNGKFRLLLKTKPGGREKFNLKSRNVIMGIRGTEVVIVNPPQVKMRQRFVVIDGRAEVWTRNGRPIILNRLEMLETVGDQLDAVGVQKINEKEAAQMSSSIEVSNGTSSSPSAAPGGTSSSEESTLAPTFAPVAPTLDQHRALPKIPSTGSTGVIIDVQQGP